MRRLRSAASPRSDVRPSLVPDETRHAAKTIDPGLAQPHDLHPPHSAFVLRVPVGSPIHQGDTQPRPDRYRPPRIFFPDLVAHLRRVNHPSLLGHRSTGGTSAVRSIATVIVQRHSTRPCRPLSSKEYAVGLRGMHRILMNPGGILSRCRARSELPRVARPLPETEVIRTASVSTLAIFVFVPTSRSGSAREVARGP
jgi:hypothetical protein